MGCYKSKCKECGKEIKASDSMLRMSFAQMNHEEDEHPKIHKHNLKVHEDFNKEFKKINDKKIFSEKILFGATEWDGEDMTDEEARRKGYL